MTRLQDDFYHAINGEWEKTAVIPDDKPRTGGFSDLADEIENLMLETTDQWLAGENVPDNAILQNFIKFHRMVRTLTNVRQWVSSLLNLGLKNTRSSPHSQNLLRKLLSMRCLVSPMSFHSVYLQTS